MVLNKLVLRRIMKCVAVKIYGSVQGVFFRANTKEKADELGIRGWVKNDSDGGVSAVFEGPEEAVNELLKWCKKGPESAQVEKVEVKETEAEGFIEFEIRY